LRHDSKGIQLLADHLDSEQRKQLGDLLVPPSHSHKELLKQNEALLRSVHRRERQYLGVVHDILIVLDTELCIRLASRSACKLLGRSEAELVGKRWVEEFVPQDRVVMVQTILQQVLSGTLEEDYEYPIVTGTGEERVISWRSGLLKEGSGNLSGVVCSGEDLTMLRQANAALERSEERLHLIMDSVGEDEFFITDRDGFIISWIARSKDGRNYRAEEMVGRHFSCLYSPEDFQAGKPMRIIEIAENNGRFEEDGWRVRKDGTRSRAYVIVTAIRDNEHHVLGFSSVTRYVVEPAEASAKRLFPLAVPVTEFP
jgi:PAS domain S-box-containing protein